MTTILSLYGGPGSGKSTSAAFMFAMFKHAGTNAELVREYVKDNWAWEKRPIGEFDQLYFLAKQMRREYTLLDKVDFVVTDSPVWMASYYAEKYCEAYIRHSVLSSALGYYEQTKKRGHRHVHVWVKRSKPYNPAGRYQTETEARAIDGELRAFLEERGIPLVEVSSDPESLTEFVSRICAEVVNERNPEKV